MAKRIPILHIPKREDMIHLRAQKSTCMDQEITITPMIRVFWCGKQEEVLVEEPLILTEEEKKMYAEADAKLPTLEYKVCAKCREVKDRHMPQKISDLGRGMIK